MLMIDGVVEMIWRMSREWVARTANLKVGSKSVGRFKTRSFPIYGCSAFALGGYLASPELLLPTTPRTQTLHPLRSWLSIDHTCPPNQPLPARHSSTLHSQFLTRLPNNPESLTGKACVSRSKTANVALG